MRILEQKNPRQKCVNHENAMNLVTKKHICLHNMILGFVCVKYKIKAIIEQDWETISSAVSKYNANSVWIESIFSQRIYSVKITKVNVLFLLGPCSAPPCVG